jgi:iron-sulfur cluster repair protein YtfE (RIC family)
MNGIEHLLHEHRIFQPELEGLRAAAADLAARGDAALPDAVPVLAAFGRFMETTLALHAQKEDDALFPAVEAVLGEDSGPTPVFRAEHVEIHGRGADLRGVIDELEAEHPVIEEKGAALRSLDGGGDAAGLRVLAEELVALIDGHFAKEEQVLFPMCEQLLAPEVLDAIGRQMEELAPLRV